MSEKRTNLLATTALAAALSVPGAAYATGNELPPLDGGSSSITSEMILPQNSEERQTNTTLINNNHISNFNIENEYSNIISLRDSLSRALKSASGRVEECKNNINPDTLIDYKKSIKKIKDKIEEINYNIGGIDSSIEDNDLEITKETQESIKLVTIAETSDKSLDEYKKEHNLIKSISNINQNKNGNYDALEISNAILREKNEHNENAWNNVNGQQKKINGLLNEIINLQKRRNTYIETRKNLINEKKSLIDRESDFISKKTELTLLQNEEKTLQKKFDNISRKLSIIKGYKTAHERKKNRLEETTESSVGNLTSDGTYQGVFYSNNFNVDTNTTIEDNIAIAYLDNFINEGIHRVNEPVHVSGDYTNHNTLDLNNELNVDGAFESKENSSINVSAGTIKANNFKIGENTKVNLHGDLDELTPVFKGGVDSISGSIIQINTDNTTHNSLFDFNWKSQDDTYGVERSVSDKKTAAFGAKNGLSPKSTGDFVAGLTLSEKAGDRALNQAYRNVLHSGNADDIKLAAEQSTTSGGDGAAQAITGTSRAAAGAISVRLAAAREGTQTAGLQQSGTAAGDSTRRNGAWMKATGGIATQNVRNGVAGNRANTYGTTIGLDNKVTEKLRLGGALSYAQSNVKGKDSGQTKTDINSYQVALYGSYEPGRYFVEGQLAWAHNAIKTSRQITFGGLNRTANGEYNAQQYSANAAVGMPLHKGAITLTPKAGMFYSYSSPSRYTETGADGANLTVNPPSTQILEGSLGGVVAYDRTTRSGAQLRPELRAAALYEFLGDDGTATAKYSGAGPTLQTPGLKPSKFGGTVGAGMGYTTSDGIWEIRADYDAELRAGYVSHNGMLTGRINF